jgi:L-asparaginase
MTRPRLLVLSLGGTITMVPGAGGGIAPQLEAEDLVASAPGLADIAAIEARSPHRLSGPSLTPGMLVEAAAEITAAFAAGTDAALVIQGTDTLEESAFLLDLLVPGDAPVVLVGAMRGAAAPGADGPANLLAAAAVAVAPSARGLGALVVMNDEIHAARLVQKGHTALPSALVSPMAGPLGPVVEGRALILVRVPRLPVLPPGGAPAPVALLTAAIGDDGALIRAVPGLGYAGLVVAGMGGGHVPATVAQAVGEVAARIPVVLASRCESGPALTRTYGYAGGEIDLIARGAIPAGILSALKARLLLALALRNGPEAVRPAFAAYQLDGGAAVGAG